MSSSEQQPTEARAVAVSPLIAPGHPGPLCEVDRSVASLGITIYGCGPDEALLFSASAHRFGIMPTITDVPVSDATIELASGNRCISVGHKSRLTETHLRRLDEVGVRYISTRSIGYNHIDMNGARRFGLRVENVTYSPDSVADYTLMLMLMAVRNAKATIERTQAHDYRLSTVRAKELRDMTIGVIGTGRIGAAVIDRLRGFGCNVVAYDRCPKTSVRYVPLDELLQQSDMVTLHTPLNADSHHLFNRRRIEQMRHNAFLVNAGRGALVDTEALLAALERGRLGGAALDVLEGEEGIFYSNHREQPIEHPLLLRLQALPNVLITPHTAYYTEHALRDVIENTITNCLNFERIPAWRA